MTAYPPAERLEHVDELHGRPVADPYRWLEDEADPRTVAWSAAQDDLARGQLDALPGRDRLAGSLSALLAAGWVSVPRWRAGRAFFTRRAPGQEHGVLHVREPAGPGVESTERVLIDPTGLDPSGHTTLDSWLPDTEGRALAYQLSVGGTEESTLAVLDVTTGEPLDGPIDRCRYSSVAWLPGGKEFYYVRKVGPGEAGHDKIKPGAEDFHRRIWRHRIGTPTSEDVLVDGPALYDEHTCYSVDVSPDGRWLVVSGAVGTARRTSVWLADLADPTVGSTPQLRVVLTQADDVRCTAWVERDGRLYLLTTAGAPRWRLCVADPGRPERERWTELIGEEPDSVLDAVRWLPPAPGDAPLLVAARSRHAVSEVTVHDATTGALRHELALPGTGTVTGLSTADQATPEQHGRLWLGWTDFVTPPEVHCYTAASDERVREAAAPGAVQLPDARTEQVEFSSADGTVVRMFVVSPAGPAAGGTGPRPALLTGYGGFALSYSPAYSASALAWVSAGGIWAVASLRGGGEEGEDWHRAGMRESKQRVFDDFHAAADALVASGRTTQSQLAISGGSNGGLLVGAALVQRPAAYRAVVCSAPLLDMVRYEQFSLGRTWNDEYGSADDPTELGWLLSYSPYHRVADRAADTVAYPAVLFTVFASDSRVDPLHARKMCAALQHATTGDAGSRPILLRRETEVGHGARSVTRSIALATDQLAFLATYTGLAL